MLTFFRAVTTLILLMVVVVCGLNIAAYNPDENSPWVALYNITVTIASIVGVFALWKI